MEKGLYFPKKEMIFPNLQTFSNFSSLIDEYLKADYFLLIAMQKKKKIQCKSI